MSESTSLDDGRITFGPPEPDENDVTDPVCGRRVDLSAPFALKLERDGKTYCFCSNDCRALFDASPPASLPRPG